tara:strand:+ start:121 stop:321 length:201 start_codon:yes stop_codon:yes gene_type:complete
MIPKTGADGDAGEHGVRQLREAETPGVGGRQLREAETRGTLGGGGGALAIHVEDAARDTRSEIDIS